VIEEWTSTQLEIVPGGDHYLVGRADQLMAVSLSWLEHLTRRSA
jgi:hypothetical protein